MEEKAQSQLELLAQKLHQKRPMDCKDAINALSPEELTAILDALVELVKEGTQSHKNIRLLANCLSFFPEEKVFEFLQRLRTDDLLQQFCRFFDENPDFYCLVRMSKILLTKSEDDFLRQILTILKVPIGIQTLRFLEKEITSPLSREITVELREKILNFLWPMGKRTVRAILGKRSSEPFDINIWIIETRKIIENYKSRQPRSE